MLVPTAALPYVISIAVAIPIGLITYFMSRRHPSIESETHWIATGRVPIPATLITTPDPRPMTTGRVPQLAIDAKAEPDTNEWLADLKLANQKAINSVATGQPWRAPGPHEPTVALLWSGQPTHASRICNKCTSGDHRHPSRAGECFDRDCSCPVRPMRVAR